MPSKLDPGLLSASKHLGQDLVFLVGNTHQSACHYYRQER